MEKDTSAKGRFASGEKNLKEQLNGLPRQNLSFKTTFKLRIKLYSLVIKEKSSIFFRLPSYRILLLNKSVSFSLVIIIIFTSTSMYAYASNSVTVGHTLYPIKKGIEETEKTISLTDSAKVKVYSKLSERRLEEAVNLSKKTEKDAALIKIVNEAVDDIKNSLAIADESAKKDSLSIETDDFYDSKINKLEQVASNVGIESSEEVIDSVAIALDEVKNYKTKYNKKYNQGENVIKNNITIEEVETLIEFTKENLNSNDEYKENKEKLFRRVDEKFNKAKEAAEEGNNEKADGLIKSTEAILNNAKHFVKIEDEAPENQKAEEQKPSNMDNENYSEVKGVKIPIDNSTDIEQKSTDYNREERTNEEKQSSYSGDRTDGYRSDYSTSNDKNDSGSEYGSDREGEKSRENNTYNNESDGNNRRESERD